MAGKIIRPEWVPSAYKDAPKTNKTGTTGSCTEAQVSGGARVDFIVPVFQSARGKVARLKSRRK